VLKDDGSGADSADDTLPSTHPDAAPVTTVGELWICGDHSVFCGNSCEAKAYEEALGRKRADIVFTDPPYNVPIAGFVTKREGSREFAMASGEMTSEGFVGFLSSVFGNVAANVHDGAVLFVCMDWRHYSELLAGARRYFPTQKNLIVWAKPNGGQGSFYRSQHELIAVFVAGGGNPTNNFGLGARGRYRTNVWRYPTTRASRESLLALHPTVKPVALVADALRDCSRRGDLVLDPFGGSGTTMIAAQRTGRRARLIEIDPLYCDLIVRRWEAKSATLASSGKSFEEVAQLRKAEAA
jgi:DNA modification methylase